MNEPFEITESHKTLPEPDAESLRRSRDMCEHIREVCDDNGAVPFSEFMQMALYTPGLGYYSGGLQKFGTQGDFITSPEISPLFSQCLARQCADVLANLNHPDIIEFGAGSGVMAADVLLELERLNALPVHYCIIELSGELKLRQAQTIKQKAGHLLDRVKWLDILPDKISGVILANEVLDAMPVECFRINNNTVESLFINFNNDELQSEYRAANEVVTQSVRVIEERREAALPDAYCSEFNPAIGAWLQSLSTMLESGLVLLVDYGYSVKEYYHEQRRTGTLMCHYQHRAHADPLWYPGLQDITAFVDFSAAAYAAVDAEFDVSGYTSQAGFLFGCGLAELHEAQVTDEVKQQITLSQQIKTLTMPSEMGERFKVMALTKNYDEALRGFEMQDFRNRL